MIGHLDMQKQYVESEAESRQALGVTRRGCKTKPNEDRHLIRIMPDHSLLMAVADGLGGGVSGGLAAEIAMERLTSLERIELDNEPADLACIARHIDDSIFRKASSSPRHAGMGSTLTAVLLRKDMIFWVHVGDSRLYLFRNGRLSQLTEDQTLARFLLAEGEITPQQATAHYSRHVMEQFMGCGHSVPETGRQSVFDKDLLILTSDGLHQPIAISAFCSILKTPATLADKAGALIQTALDHGGNDDMTIVMAGVASLPSATQSPLNYTEN